MIRVWMVIYDTPLAKIVRYAGGIARNIKYEAQMLFLSLDRLFEYFNSMKVYFCASENRCAPNERRKKKITKQQHSTRFLSLSISH